MKIDPKTILGIALMGGIGFVAWKFYKGDWKLPSLPSLGSVLSGVPGVPADIDITLGESGVPGAAGDVVYNILYPGNLREETTIPGTPYYEKAKQEIIRFIPQDQTPTPQQIIPRSVAMKVSTDIVEKAGLFKSMVLAPVTIGAGLGAIKQQEEYYASLPEGAKQEAIAQTVATRETWKKEHPVEHIAATGLSMMFPPAFLIGQAAEAYDRLRAGSATPITTATVAAAPVSTPVPAPIPSTSTATPTEITSGVLKFFGG